MSVQALTSVRQFPDKNLTVCIKVFALAGIAMGLSGFPAVIQGDYMPLAVRGGLCLFYLALIVGFWRLYALRRWAAVVAVVFMGVWAVGVLCAPLPVWQYGLMVTLCTALIANLVLARKQLLSGL